MIFINNKYTCIYNSLILVAKTRAKRDDTYYERHHIIPKSLGGGNEPENLVYLTGREHLICHLLLIRMTQGEHKAKMINAAWSMANLNNSNQQRQPLTARQYAVLREQFSQIHSNRMKNNNPMHNPIVRKIYDDSIKRRGKTSGMTGKRHSEDTKRKIHLKNKNQIVPIEKRKAASLFHSNRSLELTEKYKSVHASNKKCEHCGKLSNPGTYARWHGNNCKTINMIL